jgi:cell division protein ZapB
MTRRIVQQLIQPVIEGDRRTGAQRAAQRAMGFGSTGRATRFRERVLEPWKCDAEHGARVRDRRTYRSTSSAMRGDARSIDRPCSGFYISRMNDASNRPSAEAELKRLEKRIDDLVSAVRELKDENRALRQRQDALSAERATLLQKNEQVRARVEAMIGRLKAMEHGT